jgi:hypothetical protein
VRNYKRPSKKDKKLQAREECRDVEASLQGAEMGAAPPREGIRPPQPGFALTTRSSPCEGEGDTMPHTRSTAGLPVHTLTQIT